jgi:hypothetical protein
LEGILNNITFSAAYRGDIGPQPTPCSQAIPEWYKKISTYVPDHVPAENQLYPVRGTIKKCMPVFDSITAGYMLYTPCDVIVSTVDGKPYFNWESNHNIITFHSLEQTGNHPKANTEHTPKWTNFWSIKTPKGYSCLFTAPMHGDESPFAILPGIVDTDTFIAPVNLPFTFKDPDFNGYIPKGTPMCQVIPFKREDWEMKIGSTDDALEANNQAWKLGKLDIFKYKTSWWNRKTFK